MTRKPNHPSLNELREILNRNTEAVWEQLPQTHAAAEMVHQGFSTLIQEQYNFTKEHFLNQQVRIELLHAAWHDWALAYKLTSGGYKSAGLALFRRSIEYTAYAAKIGDNRKRAELWLDQVPASADIEDPERALERFKGQFRIPTSFANKKYAFLHALLGIYDYASDYGTHGNRFTMFFRDRRIEETHARLDVYDKLEDRPRSALVFVVYGLWLLRAFDNITSNHQVDRKKWLELLNAVKVAVQKARVATAEEPDASTLKHIVTDDQSFFIERFEAFVKRVRASKPKKD